MVTEKSRETRLRRIAERRGLRLEKSRRRDALAPDFGEYYLTDAKTNVLLAGADHSLPDLDAVERWLVHGGATTHYYADILDHPEFSGLGPVASPSYLAYLLAHPRSVIERETGSRPSIRAYAEENGRERNLSEHEAERFSTALDEAVERLAGTSRRAR